MRSGSAVVTLEHWCVFQAQSDLVDANCQNRDGLNPLMLAIRDIDMFEELGSLLPWEYRPVEVVRELLAASV